MLAPSTRLALAFAAFAGLALGAGGCGDDGPTAEGWRRDATALCTRVGAQIDAVAAPAGLGGVVAYAAAVQELVESGAEELRALEVPPELGAAATELFDAVRALPPRLEAVGAASTLGAPAELQAAVSAAEPDLDHVDQASAGAGLAVCTSESWGRVAFFTATALGDGTS